MKSALGGARVLLVAPHSDARQQHAVALARAGAAVRWAASAPEALSILLVESFDAIVCDVVLPGRTGLEWIGTVRGLSDSAKRSVAAIGIVESEAQIAASTGSRRFDECLAKPVSGTALVQRLGKLLTSRAGTLVTRKLPRIQIDEPKAAPPTEPGATGEHSTAERSLDGLTILVIDDRLATLDMLEMALGDAGATVFTSTRADDGLALLQSKPIDAVICDLKMPQVDGHEWIRRVRGLAQQEKREIPAIAMTGDASWSFADPSVATSVGFDHHMTKPFEPRSAIAEIARLVRDSRRRSLKKRPRAAMID